MSGDTFYVTSFRGLGEVTTHALRDTFPHEIQILGSATTRNYDITLFNSNASLEKLLRLGTTEDIFFFLANLPLTGAREDLLSVESTLASCTTLPRSFALRKKIGQEKIRRRTFRIVAQAEDASWRQYRRLSMQRAAEKGIMRRYPTWKLVDDKAGLEFWIQQTNRHALVGLRLSDRTMRHRTYKTANLPGALRPSIAYAMAYLSGVEDDDVFLDPMCGTGTILIERARAGRYQLLRGGDISREAVEATLTNFGKQHKPRIIQQWDATNLPIENASVDKLVTNLPWGRQIGTLNSNASLYVAFAKEMERVLRPGGRAVLLTALWKVLKNSLQQHPNLILLKQVKNISVLGWHADIFVVTKGRQHILNSTPLV